MTIQTCDITTWITEKSDSIIVYENSDGKKWQISGICNACGLCEIYEPPVAIGEIILHTNISMVNGDKKIWTRRLKWNHAPGTPGACEEIDYDNRLDIPITPDAVNRIEECTLTGKWIE